MKVFSVMMVIFSLPYKCVISRSEMKLDPNRLSAFVKAFVNSALKRSEMQEYIYKDLSFKKDNVNVQTDLNKMSNLYSSLLGLQSVIEDLRKAALQAHVTKVATSHSCCTSATGKYNPRFKLKVDSSKACVILAKKLSSNPFHLNNVFKETCERTATAHPHIKWMYFASGDGVTTLYPSSSSACNVADTRFRPWYLQTIYRHPKLVMIVIDKSTSMGRIVKGIKLMDLAKESAKAIIELLNPYDKFGVLAFANRPETWRSPYGGGGCPTTNLSVATPKNKNLLSGFVDSLTARGGSSYIAPITVAFDFLIREANANPAGTDNVIHFLTDGETDDVFSLVSGTISLKALELAKAVHFIAYRIGEDSSPFLTKLSSFAAPHNLGLKLHFIRDKTHIKNQMADIYHGIATRRTDINIASWSSPYLDAAGLGQVMTMSLPVYKRNLFFGVVGLDVDLNDVFSRASFYKPSELSYAFVVAHSGLVLSHPFFSFSNDEDSSLIRIVDLETDAALLPYVQSIEGGSSASVSYKATKVLSLGSSKKYGVLKRQVVSTVAWMQIPKTSLSFGVSIAKPTKETRIVKGGEKLDKDALLYHRFDVVPPKKQCVHVNSLASPDKSSVFFAKRAFVDPDSVNIDLKPGDVRGIADFVESNGPSSIKIKESARREAVATHWAEDLWLKRGQDSQLKNQVIWRYVGTKHGSYRVYPGTQLPFDFDPVRRSWYEQAVANRNKSVITTPYKDAASGSAVISLSHALFEKRPENANDLKNKEIFAVMGVDFLLTYFYDIFLRMYPVCQEDDFKCLVIDNGGYVILTDEYIAGSFQSEVHLAEIEPQVTSVLIRKGVLQRVECSNVASGLLQRTYSISEHQGEFWGTYGRGFWDFFGFKLLPVPGTNAFLIIRSVSDSKCVNVFHCHCQENAYAEDKLCKSTWKDRFCECPCPSNNPYYESCSNTYTTGPTSPLPCTPESPSITPLSIEYDLSFLPNCYNISFQRFIEAKTDYTYHIVGSCLGVVVLIISLCFFWSHPKIEERRKERRLKAQEAAIEALKNDLMKPNESEKVKGHHHFVYSHKMTRLFSKLRKSNPRSRV